MRRTRLIVPDLPAFPIISIGELAGSVGNFGTILPLFFAISLTTGMSLSLMLLLCGIWYIITGVVYQIPIPVEPFKAVAAVAIAGAATPGSIAASGILNGVIFLVLGLTKSMEWMVQRIPNSVIRGIQLALGFLLFKSAIFDMGLQDFPFFAGCVAIIFFFLIGKRFLNIPDLTAMMILGVGVGTLIISTGIPAPALPTAPYLIFPDYTDFINAASSLVLPQIPLTLANAVLATSLLASELYQKHVSADRLSRTIGVMSLSTSLFGGFPMCHGAGGVAAHHRFGAQSGTAIIIGGCILIGAAAFFTQPETLTAIPKGVFGALLLAVAIELVRHGIRTENPLVTGVIGILALPAGIAIAFIMGVILAVIMQYRDKNIQKRKKS